MFSLNVKAQFTSSFSFRKTFEYSKIIEVYKKRSGEYIMKYLDKKKRLVKNKMGWKTPFLFNNRYIYRDKKGKKYFYYIYKENKIIIVFLKK